MWNINTSGQPNQRMFGVFPILYRGALTQFCLPVQATDSPIKGHRRFDFCIRTIRHVVNMSIYTRPGWFF